MLSNTRGLLDDRSLNALSSACLQHARLGDRIAAGVEALVLDTCRKHAVSLAKVIGDVLCDDRPHLVSAGRPQQTEAF